MATCSICELKSAKHTLKNARHLNGSRVCDDCYKSCDEHEMQGYLLDTPTPEIEFDFDKPLDYEELKGFITTKLNYKSMTDFFIEIDMNPRSAVQTWKKNKKIPFLAQAYIQNKIDSINKIDEVKEVTKFVEITREIPEHTFEKDGTTLQKITNIDEIVTIMKNSIENGYKLLDDGVSINRKENSGTIYQVGGEFHHHSIILDNCYETELFKALYDNHHSVVPIWQYENLKEELKNSKEFEDKQYASISKLQDTIDMLENKLGVFNSSCEDTFTLTFDKKEKPYLELIMMNVNPDYFGNDAAAVDKIAKRLNYIQLEG